MCLHFRYLSLEFDVMFVLNFGLSNINLASPISILTVFVVEVTQESGVVFAMKNFFDMGHSSFPKRQYRQCRKCINFNKLDLVIF